MPGQFVAQVCVWGGVEKSRRATRLQQRGFHSRRGTALLPTHVQPKEVFGRIEMLCRGTRCEVGCVCVCACVSISVYMYMYIHTYNIHVYIYTHSYTHIGWSSPDAVGAGAVASSSSAPTETSRHAAAAEGRVSARGGKRMGWCSEIRPESGGGSGGGGGGGGSTDNSSNSQSNGQGTSSCAQGMGVSGRYTRAGGGSICRVMSSAQYVRESLSFVRTMCAARQKLGVSPMAHILKSTRYSVCTV
jgi:hypothetical protein